MKIITLCFIALFSVVIYAQIPQTISWQGIVQDSSGTNLDGDYNITVKLYDVSTGGVALWTETHTNATITNGLANITLGSITPFSVTFDSQYWLEITVGTGTPLPRIALTSVPSSLHAGSIADNSVNSDKIENGTIAGIDISQMSATNGQVLEWNGTTWSPTTLGEFHLPYTDSLSTAGSIFKLTNNLGVAIEGVGPKDEFGYLGGSNYGVFGKNEEFNNSGYLGSFEAGAMGENTSGNKGFLGKFNYAVYGEVLSNNVQDCGFRGDNSWAGTYGTIASYEFGVYGFGPGGNQGLLGSKDYGVFGFASTDTNEAVYGKSFTNGNIGYLAGGNYGVYGEVAVDTNEAVYGRNIARNNFGYLGGGNYGVYGETSVDTNKAVYGRNNSNGNYGYIGGEAGVVGVNGDGYHTGKLGQEIAGVYAKFENGSFKKDVYIATSIAGLSTTDNNGNYAALLDNDLYAVRGDINSVIASRYSAAVFGYNHGSLTEGSLGRDDYAVYGYTQNDTTIAVYGGGHQSKTGYLGSHAYGVYGSGGATFGYIGSDSVSVYGKHYWGNYAYLGSDNYAVYGNAHYMYDTAGVFVNSWKDNIAILGSPDIAVYGKNGNGNKGYLGDENYGAYGEYNNGNFGLLGNVSYGAYGKNSNGNKGYFGSSIYGAYGENSNGNKGHLGSTTYGAYGENNNGSFGYLGGTHGVYGEGHGGNVSGVRGKHLVNNNIGYLGDVGYGVYGANGNGNKGHLGSNNYGAYGVNISGAYGYLGGNSYGVEGKSNGNLGRIGGSTFGVYAYNTNGKTAFLATDWNAGEFSGNVYISGNLGVNQSSPTYGLHLPNSPAFNKGKALAYSWDMYSDSRLKFNQREIDYGIETVLQLTPKRYEHHSSTFENGSLKILPDFENTIGLIAQEVYKIVPEAVTKPEDESTDNWSMDYTKLIPVLIKGMQEQQTIIEKQKKRLEELEKKIEFLMKNNDSNK